MKITRPIGIDMEVIWILCGDGKFNNGSYILPVIIKRDITVMALDNDPSQIKAQT